MEHAEFHFPSSPCLYYSVGRFDAYRKSAPPRAPLQHGRPAQRTHDRRQQRLQRGGLGDLVAVGIHAVCQVPTLRWRAASRDENIPVIIE
jgi:hypothetical protein